MNEYIEISKQYEPNIEIWIADNVTVRAKGKYTRWNRFWLKTLLGLKVTKYLAEKDGILGV